MPFTVNSTVTPSVSISTGMTGTYCYGTNFSFTATPTNGGTSPNYQWLINGSAVSGATGSTFSSTTLTNGQSISLSMGSTASCPSPASVNSNAIVVSVTPTVGTPSTISGPTAPARYGTSSYSTTATNATSYTWYLFPAGAGTINSSGVVTWSNINVGPPTIEVSANGCNGPSALTTLVVNPYAPLAGGLILSGNVAMNATADPGPLVADAAYGGVPGSPYNYQWQQSSSPTGPFTNISGATNMTYSPGSVSATTYYQRQVSCGPTDKAYTNIASVTIGTVDSINWNYVRERDISKPGITDLTSAAALTDPYDVKQTTQYLDGLGRPVQAVNQQASPSLKDMVTSWVYDPLGRESVKFMPYNTTSTDGNYKPDPSGGSTSFNTAKFTGEQYYYGWADLEASPLGRPLTGYAPGLNWTGSGRGVSSQYSSNTASDSVQIWRISMTVGSLPADSGVYLAGQLYKSVTVDEQGNQAIEYKDMEGHTLLKKVQQSTTPGTAHIGWLCTYYIYDDLGNLRFIISPRAVVAINAGGFFLPPLPRSFAFGMSMTHADG